MNICKRYVSKMSLHDKRYVYQKNKQTGRVYVYENYPYWDKATKKDRANRVCVGKLDENGNLIQTRGRKANHTLQLQEAQPLAKRSYYGATYLLDAIGNQLGITRDLQMCFPHTYKQILSLAYYLILETDSPLYRFTKWHNTHKHPYDNDISSQRSSELFASITEAAKARFFMLQGKRREETEYWALDSTSISSFSETLKQVKFGHNKENDSLPQINFALVYGEKSKLPFYYKKHPGNMPESKTIKNLLAELMDMGLTKVKLLTDRGCYSEANINEFYQSHIKFLVGVRTGLKYVRNILDTVSKNISTLDNYSQEYGVYGCTVKTQWDYKQERPYRGDVLKGKKKVYLHIYYNIDKAAEDERKLISKLARLRSELLSNNRIEAHEKSYDKYFIVTQTPKRGIKVITKEDVIQEEKKYYGYFALLSNEVKDTWEALYLYRMKDLVEKAFSNLKDRLNMRRMLVSSEQSLDGKLFVQFVALIFMSYINKQMCEKKMYKDYTLQEVLDTLDVIDCYEFEGKKLRAEEILEEQRALYIKFGVPPL